MKGRAFATVHEIHFSADSTIENLLPLSLLSKYCQGIVISHF